jgi:hypothetical protein
VAQAKGGLAARLDGLASGFHYVAPDGRDMGSNVRHRAQAILALLRDEGRLAAEREAHARKRGTYQGFSSLDMAQGGPVQQQQEGGGWQAAAADGGHLARAQQGEEQQPGSPRLRQAGETKGVR